MVNQVPKSPILTCELIKEVKKRPFLYDTSHPEYTNLAKKAIGWQEISVKLGVDNEVAVLKQKWKNLKDNYKRHLRAHMLKDKAPRVVQKMKNWVWAKKLKFLEECNNWHEQLELEKQSVEMDDQEVQYFEIEPKLEPDDKSETSADEEYFTNCESQFVFSVAESNDNRKRKLGNDVDALADDREDDNTGKLDKTDYLFLHYSEVLKKLSPLRQATVKLEIAKIFSKAEIDELQSNQKT